MNAYLYSVVKWFGISSHSYYTKLKQTITCNVYVISDILTTLNVFTSAKQKSKLHSCST